MFKLKLAIVFSFKYKVEKLDASFFQNYSLYFLFRGMHPWRTEVIPDFGKFAYRHVHALHHKSYNPTAFSGTR